MECSDEIFLSVQMWMGDGGNRFFLVYDCVGHNAPVYSLCSCEDEKKVFLLFLGPEFFSYWFFCF